MKPKSKTTATKQVSPPSNTPDLITSMTKVDYTGVSEILKLLETDTPPTLARAQEIIESRYSTDEEKAQAHLLWTQISKQRIETATNFGSAYEAVRSCNKKNLEVLMLAVKKAVNTHKSREELSNLLYMIKDINQGIKCVLEGIILPALIKYATTPSLMLAMWDDFKGTKFAEDLLRLTRGYIRKMPPDDTTKKVLHSLYTNMEKMHPCAFVLYKKLVKCSHSSEELRALRSKMNTELAEAEKHNSSCCGQSDTNKRKKRADHLKFVMKDLQTQIDKTFFKELSKVKEYSELMDAFARTEKLRLRRSQNLIIRRLKVHWNKRLRAKRITFVTAFNLFNEVCKVDEVRKVKVHLARVWSLTRRCAKNIDQAKELADAAKRTIHYKQSVWHWLSFYPKLDEMIKLLTTEFNAREVEQLELTVIGNTNTIKDGLRLIKVNWDGAVLRVAQRLATLIQKLTDGLIFLEKMEARDTRYIIITATLEHVSNEEELGLVVNATKSYMTDPEKRLFVKKALELIKAGTDGGGSDDS